VELDDAAKILRGHEDIVWINRSGEPVSDMLFHLYWNAFKNEASAFFEEALRENSADLARRPGSGEWGWINVTAVRVADGPDLRSTMEFVTPDGPAHPADQTVMRVRFPRPVASGHDVRLRLDFTAKIPRTVARSGYYGHAYFIGQWFPKPGVYQAGKGWNAHAYHADSEFFADFADFTVHITVPRGFVVGASGRETGTETDSASARTTYTFCQSMIHDFAWTADPRFIRVERDFVARREVTPQEYEAAADLLGVSPEAVRLPDVRMILLIEPEHRAQVERHFRALRAAIKFYGLWYGPYPYDTVTMVDPPFGTDSGGMEYPTLFTAGTSVLANRKVLEPEGVIVHEFGHGYWYGVVANNEFEEAWLDEGINTYSTGRVLARVFGRGAMALDLNGIPLTSVFRLPKALDFEKDRVAAIGIVKSDPVLRESWRFLNSASYGANVYSRASTCLNTLERLLGERTMARVMRAYYQQFRFRHPTTRDFIGVVNEVSGRDLTWFFEELLMDTLDFDYGISSCVSVERPTHLLGVFDTKHGQEEMTAEQARALEAGGGTPPGRVEYITTVTLRRYGEARVGGDARVKLEVTFEDGSRETRFWDGQDRWTRILFTKPSRARTARLDPDGVWLIDSNVANNSYTTRPVWRGLGGLLARLVFNVQNLLLWLGSIS
jgi:hypothetical protein